VSNIITLGAGNVWVKPTTGTYPNAIRLMTAKKITVTLSKNPIDLEGSYEFPIDTAGGKASCKLQIDVAGLDTGLFGAAFSGTTTSTGYTAMATDEAKSVPGSVSYTITVDNAAGGIKNFGVLYAADNTPLTPAATATGAGVYSVVEATGVYTFNVADASKAMLLSYSYAVAGSGITVDVKSALIGSAPAFEVFGWNVYNGKKVGYRFPTAKLTGGKFDFSTEAHATPQWDLTANALPGQSVFTMFFA
jgi:hypothetical protein